MATLRLFARAREIAGTGTDTVSGRTVDDVLAEAVSRYGGDFADVLASCKVWVNGEEVPGSHVVGDSDEVAVLPPVSGGCQCDRAPARVSAKIATSDPSASLLLSTTTDSTRISI